MKVQNSTFNNHKKQQNFGNILIQGEKISEKATKTLIENMATGLNMQKSMQAIIEIEKIDKLHPMNSDYVVDIRQGGKDTFQLFAGKKQTSMVYPTELIKMNPIENLTKRLTESFEYLRDEVLGS